jgi:hypothetical protein
MIVAKIADFSVYQANKLREQSSPTPVSSPVRLGFGMRNWESALVDISRNGGCDLLLDRFSLARNASRNFLWNGI